MCAAEVVPVSLGVIGVQPHCLPNPFYAVLGPAQPREKLAVLNQDEVVVGIEAQRALLMILSLLVVAMCHVHGSEDPVHVAVVVIEGERDRKFGDHLLPDDFTILAPVIDPG